jgi:hypothetical protein
MDSISAAAQAEFFRSKILEISNDIIVLENGPVPVEDVRIVPAETFFGMSYGTSMLLDDGKVVLRITIKRPLAEVADTILHETAHVLLGREHIDQPDHGPAFQGVYERLKLKYLAAVTKRLERLA